MNRDEALEVLEKHQAWRRYCTTGTANVRPPEMQSPTAIGEAIDVAIQTLKEATRR